MEKFAKHLSITGIACLMRSFFTSGINSQEESLDLFQNW